MEPESIFRTDLYRGTAAFYARFRPPYPASLLEDLAARLPVSGRGRLLDLACGTGQAALPLAKRFTNS
jgi:trans-aconitate methyltransferase